jgi:hypothetical protein
MASGPSPSAALLLLTALISTASANASPRMPDTAFPCHVAADKPEIGFDLRFHAGYRVIAPMMALANAGGALKVTMRIEPEMHADTGAILLRTFVVPDIPPGTNGEALLWDGVELGPGRFHVEWTMQDSRGRVCSSRWDWEARLGRGQHDFPLTLAPNSVGLPRERALSQGNLAAPGEASPRRVKILLNLSPAEPSHSILAPEDTSVLFSILRGLAQEPGISYSGLIAFNLREQRIVYRADSGESIDMASLRQALRGRATGTVSYRLLKNPRSETEFVTSLLADELGAGAAAPDAIVIVGRKVTLDMKVPLASLKRFGAAPCPIFYINYSPNPVDEPFDDTIGSALKAYKGAVAYNIAFPRDVGAAVRNMLSRIGASSRGLPPH